MKKTDAVVLVHGLAAHPWMMKPLERTIRSAGFVTINWGYPSIFGQIERHADTLLALLRRLEGDAAVRRVQLVTHSMGGIVARQALVNERLKKLQSLVMLCPPNRGSRVAQFVAPMLSWFCKALRQLSASKDSYVNRLAVPDGVDIGIVAAARDRVVAVDSTHLPNEVDHCVVPCGHTSLLFRRDVAERVANFLTSARFTRRENAAKTGQRPLNSEDRRLG